MPRLDDENFTHTVSLLCEHSDDGAIGLVINRPTDLKLSEMMEQMELEHQGLADEAIVFWAGRWKRQRGFALLGKPAGWETGWKAPKDCNSPLPPATQRGYDPDN